MREILFRGKRVDDGEWVSGYYLCKKRPYFKDKGVNLEHLIWRNLEIENGDYKQFVDTIMTASVVDPETIGQYTGLTDKNGRKIFEGDIVSSGTINPYTISFNQTLCCFYLKRCDLEYGGFFTAGDAKCIEVIGNIYDNPELQTIERTYINERENRRSTKEYY